jgi:hypothetical protein
VLAQLKNNLDAPQPALAFEVTQAAGGAPTLTWLGSVEVTASDLAGRVRPRGRQPAQRRSAAVFLMELLAGGPMKVRDIWVQALKEGLSANTVRRAKDEVGIRSALVLEDGRRANYWLLPDQALASHDKPEAEMDDVDRHLKMLSDLYPPKTPLEEDDW